MSCFDKREYAAYTIRPKIKGCCRNICGPCLRSVSSASFRARSLRVSREWHSRATDQPVRRRRYITAARAAAHSAAAFLKHNLHRYANLSNQPSENATSGLSPYLHFGHISSLEVALAVQDYANEHKLIPDEFLEELIVRRELAFNFARFTENPQSLEALPDWAQKTLAKHASDRRDPVYSCDQFERAQTHDPLWNAAQRELLITGKIHGYYRMYWGKKIIEWSRTPEDALATAIYLNDRYALDGRDPNSYTNILWCFGLHDRPWIERPIFGQVRYMSLRRHAAQDRRGCLHPRHRMSGMNVAITGASGMIGKRLRSAPPGIRPHHPRDPTRRVPAPVRCRGEPGGRAHRPALDRGRQETHL